jgi:hypothetical protein
MHRIRERELSRPVEKEVGESDTFHASCDLRRYFFDCSQHGSWIDPLLKPDNPCVRRQFAGATVQTAIDAEYERKMGHGAQPA